MAEKTLNAVVLRRMEVGPGLMVLQVAPDGWHLPDFKAGQYTAIGLPESAPRVPGSDPDPPNSRNPFILRAYSIASSAEGKDHLEFYITLVKSGRLTPRLFAMNPGDRLWISPKIVGMFRLDQVESHNNILLIATGTGLAPYMSMLRTHLPRFSGQKIAVIHGARHSWDLGYRTELTMLERMSRDFTYIPIVSEVQSEPAPWRGASGYIHDFWKSGPLEKIWGGKPAPENTHAFLCGNPLMVDSMVGLLGEEGFIEHTPRQPGQIHLERYW